MSSIVWVKNTSGATDTWVGQQLDDQEYWNIDSALLTRWANNDKVLADIGSGNLVVAKSDSGSDDIVGVANQVNFLKQSQVEVANWKLSAEVGAVEVSVNKPEHSSATIVTHDWTDRTTWYQNSIRVTEEVLTDLGSSTAYDSANENWIDMYNGKVYNEDNLITTGPYTVVVTADDVLVDPSQYSINFVTGRITFTIPQVGKTIKATYSYENGSEWVLAPTPGKKLLIEHSEIQFSKDIQMQDGISFEIWVYNPADLPNKMLYGFERYKNVRDVINAGNQGKGWIPNIDTLTHDVLVFPFDYVSTKPLRSSLGAELRLRTLSGNAMNGEWATATFYVISLDDV